VLDGRPIFSYNSGMAEWTPEQMRAQWLLAGRLTGTLSVVQMVIFAILLVRTSLAFASVNFWLLILGFSISGVVAAVCLSRSRTMAVKYRR
jgi:TctA family transporter